MPKAKKYMVFYDKTASVIAVVHPDASISDHMELLYESDKAKKVLAFIEDFLLGRDGNFYEKLLELPSKTKAEYLPSIAVLIKPSIT